MGTRYSLKSHPAWQPVTRHIHGDEPAVVTIVPILPMLPPKVTSVFCLSRMLCSVGVEKTRRYTAPTWQPQYYTLVSLLVWFTFQVQCFVVFAFLQLKNYFQCLICCNCDCSIPCFLIFQIIISCLCTLPTHMLSSLLFVSFLFLCVCLNSQWQNW